MSTPETPAMPPAPPTIPASAVQVGSDDLLALYGLATARLEMVLRQYAQLQQQYINCQQALAEATRPAETPAPRAEAPASEPTPSAEG